MSSGGRLWMRTDTSGSRPSPRLTAVAAAGRVSCGGQWKWHREHGSGLDQVGFDDCQRAVLGAALPGRSPIASGSLLPSGALSAEWVECC
ncbi:hypothetical protein SAMN04488554_3842 [Ruania alba]|uniref:Uncharacterized protein n=1 Tax=Ruania alba TaxID=648782 RepID=A0A1H5N3E9_9MICO|nr:hypothetical protein SAMN04488554_3842 [Ruania alba]